MKAFTLVELMIVVVIIGILAAIAVPKYSSIQDTARQAACWSNLRCLSTAESIYFGKYDVYTDDLGSLNDVQDNASVLLCPDCDIQYDLNSTVNPDHYEITCPSAISHGSIADGSSSWQ